MIREQPASSTFSQLSSVSSFKSHLGSTGREREYGGTTNKASGGDGIPVELFQILKDDAVKSAALNMPANLENSAVAMRLEKVSFHSNPKERQCQRMLKIPHNCTHLTR